MISSNKGIDNHMSNIENRIIDIVRKNGVMNGMQICRALNGRDRCNEGYYGGTKGNDRNLLKLCKENGCEITYFKVLRILQKMEKKGLLKSDKRYYFDKWRYKGTKKLDLFRFWYVDYNQFYNKILVNTLEAYL